MVRRRAPLIVAAAVSAGLLAGCAGSGNATSDSSAGLPDQSDSTAQTTPTDTASPSATANPTTTTTPTTPTTTTTAAPLGVTAPTWNQTGLTGTIAATLRNTGQAPLTVTAVTVSLPGTAIITEPTLAGKRQPKPGGLTIPPGASVHLRPAGTAITVQLKTAPKPGQTVTVTLTTAAGAASFRVKPATDAPVVTVTPGDGATSVG